MTAFGKKETVPAKNFVQTIAANVDNEKLSDEAFREFIRHTLPIVEGGTIAEDDRPRQHMGNASSIIKPEK